MLQKTNLSTSTRLKSSCRASSLFLAGFLFVSGDQCITVRNVQFAGGLVVRATQWINVPLVVGTVRFLNMCANNILFGARINLTIIGGLPTEFSPMFEPRATRAGGI